MGSFEPLKRQTADSVAPRQNAASDVVQELRTGRQIPVAGEILLVHKREDNED